jgi:BlaI family penicillinase repressor
MAIELLETAMMSEAKKDSGADRRNSSPVLTEAEWAIMRVVWENEPCAAGTVQEALVKSRDWAYSTVKTTMDRMARKGFLRVDKIRNLQLFRPCISEVDAKRGEFRTMLKKAFDGALTPMMQFLIEHEELSQEEISQLRGIASNVKNQKE